MRKNLFYTTALVAILNVTNIFAKGVYAADLDVTDSYVITGNVIENNDGNINFESGTHTLEANGKITSSGNINVDGGNITVPSSTSVTTELNEDTISRVTAGGNFNISGGTFTTTDTLMSVNDLNVNGGTLNINIDSMNFQTGTPSIDDWNMDDSKSPKIKVLEVKNNMTLTDGNIKVNGNDKVFLSQIFSVSKDATISGGTLEVDDTSQFNIGYGYYDKDTHEVSGGLFVLGGTGSILMNSSNIPVWLEEFDINGGTLTLNGSSIVLGFGNLLKIAGGTVNLSAIETGGEPLGSRINSSASDIEISGNSVINLSGNSWLDALDQDPGHTGRSLVNDLTISGGTINISNDNNVIGAAGTIGMSGGQMNVNENSRLFVIKDNSVNQGTLTLSGTGDVNVDGEMNSDLAMSGGTVDISSTGTWNGNIGMSSSTLNNDGAINGNVSMSGGTLNSTSSGTITGDAGMTGGTINLAGDLIGNVSMLNGSDPATVNLSEAAKIDGSITGVDSNSIVNFNSNEAKVTGNATGAHLAYNTDNNLSNSVGGTISNLSALSVSSGTLTYDKDVSGKIGSVFVKNRGVLDIGTNTVTAGDVHFYANSKLALRIASTDVWGRIKADSIDISSDRTTLSITIANGLVEPGEYKDFKILDSASSITGDFASKLADNLAYDIKYLNKDTVRISLKKEPWGNDPWDTVREDDTESETTKSIVRQLEDFWQHDREAHDDMIRILRPDTAPAMQQILNETTGEVFNAVGMRLSGSNVNIGRRTIAEDKCHEDDVGVWAHGIYNKATLDENKKTHGFDSETKGVVMGIETRPTRGSKVGIGYAYTKTDIEGYHREDNVEAHSALLYGEIKPNNWFLNAIGTYSWADFEESKNAYGIPVKGKSDMEMFGLQIMTGYDIHTPVVTITPEAGIRYTHLSLDDYTDTAEQEMDADDLDIVTGVLGAKFSQIWVMYNGVVLRPELRAALTYDLTDDGFVTDVTLVNGAKYTTTAETLDRLAVEVGAGLTAEFNKNVEMSIGYDGRFREDYENHTGMIAAKYKF